ncbi:hypothetical protein DIPPA_52245 [Diplonema papillatum]|nr:hypothetical protein DIPPA_52245 [Diplonema papillatum]
MRRTRFDPGETVEIRGIRKARTVGEREGWWCDGMAPYCKRVGAVEQVSDNRVKVRFDAESPTKTSWWYSLAAIRQAEDTPSIDELEAAPSDLADDEDQLWLALHDDDVLDGAVPQANNSTSGQEKSSGASVSDSEERWLLENLDSDSASSASADLLGRSTAPCQASTHDDSTSSTEATLHPKRQAASDSGTSEGENESFCTSDFLSDTDSGSDVEPVSPVRRKPFKCCLICVDTPKLQALDILPRRLYVRFFV